ncbi:GNAT family acetyltransferase [Thalassospira profundimaris]|uniref:GNAT family acetyltransferase n=1 Tax=Thalassospira profundimaris TaxID=502049 RepID=A0A367XIX1_9PROT|nr:GNAT family protein [Thalassospira profundimaris]RCK53607.1 GNAT family acetyltransferase [Thalassospira profundimaris]
MTTTPRYNQFDQPIGRPVENWKPATLPPYTAMTGTHCRVEPIDPARHTNDLFEGNRVAATGERFTYLPYDAFEDVETYQTWLDNMRGPDPMLHAIIDLATDKAVGIAAFLRPDTTHGTIEVGHINYTPALSHTIAGTEAMYLMMKRAFDELGYRRYEWKCDDQNAPSRTAATRYGFVYEGTFRQHMVYKGRNRDSAWFSILDQEWPLVRAAFETWLNPENFDANGKQVKSLQTLRTELAEHQG